MSFFPSSTHSPRGRRDAARPATTEALPATDLPGPQWASGPGPDDGGGTPGAVAAALEGEPADGEPESFDGHPVPAPADEEPFVPKSRYVMGRSTKVMACILLVAAGVFAGSAIQKQIDTGARGARTNFTNFQGTGTGAGSGTGAGTQTPGQSRRNGGSGAGGAGTAGTAGPTGAPTAGTGQAATGQAATGQ
jgi:hypothetical protein